MIDSKKVIKRFEDDPELSFSGDKNIMPIAETIRDWFEEVGSEAKTVERILTHQTLNDYEKSAGLFFLGSLVAGRVFAAMNSIGEMEAFVERMKKWISEGMDIK